MDYKCSIELVIADDRDCTIFKDIMLPFTPFVGLEIRDATEVYMLDMTVTRIMWDIEQNRFLITCVADEETFDGVSDADFVSLAKEVYAVGGWKQ